MLINVKNANNCLHFKTFRSMINTTSERFKTRKVFIFEHFWFYEQLKFHAPLS